MAEYRRKSKIVEKIRIGNGTPLQQYIFRHPILGEWVASVAIIAKVKTFQFGGKSYRSSNSDVYRALQQLVNLGALDKR